MLYPATLFSKKLVVLEEVGLSLERDHVHAHPLERIINALVNIVVAELQQPEVGDELDVLRHAFVADSDEGDGQSGQDKLAIDADGVPENLVNSLLRQLFLQVLVDENGCRGVKVLVSRDEIVRERQPLEPLLLL